MVVRLRAPVKLSSSAMMLNKDQKIEYDTTVKLAQLHNLILLGARDHIASGSIVSNEERAYAELCRKSTGPTVFSLSFGLKIAQLLRMALIQSLLLFLKQPIIYSTCHPLPR